MSIAEMTHSHRQTDLRQARMLIGGAWVESLSGATLAVENPANRRPIAEIPRGGAADVDVAVAAAARAFPAWSKLAPRDRGRLCTAGSRLFLHAAIFDSFLDKLRVKTQALKLGDPLDEATDIGAIINEKQFRKVCSYVEEGLKRREARLVFGGLPPKEGPLSNGYLAVPTVFADNSNDWRLAREEIFGPVLVAIPWRDEAEAVGMAKDSHYGLAAYVWAHDIGSGLRTAHAIQSGWVQVNQGLGQSPGHSYGGYKQSGIGREFSLEGMLDSFTQRKNVTVNLDTPRRQ